MARSKSKYFKLGRRIRELDEPVRSELYQRVRTIIMDQANRKLRLLQAKAAAVMKRIEDLERQPGRETPPVSDLAHLSSLRQGVLWLLIGLVLTIFDGLIMEYTLRPLELGIEGRIFAFAVLLSAIVAFEKLLTHVKNTRPASYPHCLYALAFLGALCTLTGILLLGFARGALFSLQGSLHEVPVETILESVKQFKVAADRSYKPAIVFFAAGLTFASSLCFHEALQRWKIWSASPVKEKRLKAKLDEEILRLAHEMQAIKDEGERDLLEFDLGFSLPKENHLQKIQRIFLSPFFLVAVALLLILFVQLAWAKETVILFDTTLSMAPRGDLSEVEKNRRAVSQLIQSIRRGDSIKIVGIHENSFSNPKILLEGRLPMKDTYFGERSLEEKVKLSRKWEALKIDTSSRNTDLLGAILLAAQFIEDKSRSRIYIFSDMRHTTSDLDLESPKEIKKELVEEVWKKGLIPNLSGAAVYCLGVHSHGKDFRYYNSLRNFWVEYFRRAGAYLKVYSMERRLE